MLRALADEVPAVWTTPPRHSVNVRRPGSDGPGTIYRGDQGDYTRIGTPARSNLMFAKRQATITCLQAKGILPPGAGRAGPAAGVSDADLSLTHLGYEGCTIGDVPAAVQGGGDHAADRCPRSAAVLRKPGFSKRQLAAVTNCLPVLQRLAAARRSVVSRGYGSSGYVVVKASTTTACSETVLRADHAASREGLHPLDHRRSSDDGVSCAASDADCEVFLAEHTGTARLDRLAPLRRDVATAAIGDRHHSAVAALTLAFRDVIAGYFPAYCGRCDTRCAH